MRNILGAPGRLRNNMVTWVTLILHGETIITRLNYRDAGVLADLSSVIYLRNAIVHFRNINQNYLL